MKTVVTVSAISDKNDDDEDDEDDNDGDDSDGVKMKRSVGVSRSLSDACCAPTFLTTDHF